ncbi:MAG: glycosyltransferase [Anaerolineaceae bacterium]|nr:glycosyltransferase [Anaerolineaceae bacterium]
MRVLIWCPYVNLGGGKRLLAPITNALAKHPEIELVRLAIPDTAADVLPQPTDKIDVVRLTQSQCRGWLDKDKWRSQPSKLRMLRTWLNYQPDRIAVRGLLDSLQKDMDVVYIFWPHSIPFYAFSKPSVCMFQDVTSLDYPEILGSKAVAAEKINLGKWLHESTTLVVSSRNTARRIEKHYGIASDRFHLLSYHNIVLDEVAQDQVAAPPSAAVAALPARYLFYPANITVHKNHETLLNAWAHFARKNELSLVLVGEGIQILSPENQSVPGKHWREDTLRGLLNRLELVSGRDLYTFGYVSDNDLVHLMNNATALIMPTYTEGFGLPVLEALARGVPVLCSDIPVLHETLVGRSAEVLWFDPYLPEDIVRKINLLLDNYDVFKQSAEAGRKDPRPDWPDTAAQYVEVFKTAIKDHK